MRQSLWNCKLTAHPFSNDVAMEVSDAQYEDPYVGHSRVHVRAGYTHVRAGYTRRDMKFTPATPPILRPLPP